MISTQLTVNRTLSRLLERHYPFEYEARRKETRSLPVQEEASNELITLVFN
jgi:hypothetical protein